MEVGRKFENGEWTFDEVSVTLFSIQVVLIERKIMFKVGFDSDQFPHIFR